jgi:hypothetical protein
MTRYERRFRSVARSLNHLDLMRSSLDDVLGMSERDLLDKDAGRRFLDFYGDQGIRLALSRYGIEDALRKRGYVDFQIETRAFDDRHSLSISGHHEHDPNVRHRLIELAVRRDRLIPNAEVYAAAAETPSLDSAYDVLTVDWLLLQDPRAEFTPERPRLPGQEAPGLGIGERVLELLYRIATRLELHALVTVAEHFHNASLYRRELPYFDPTEGGRFRALERVLMKEERLSLAQASWAVEWGSVHEHDGNVLRWRGEVQLRSFEPALTTWLASAAHRKATRQVANNTVFFLDRDKFDARWEAERANLEGRTSP